MINGEAEDPPTFRHGQQVELPPRALREASPAFKRMHIDYGSRLRQHAYLRAISDTAQQLAELHVDCGDADDGTGAAPACAPADAPPAAPAGAPTPALALSALAAPAAAEPPKLGGFFGWGK